MSKLPSGHDEFNENMFRQSALHLGVTRSQHLKYLLDLGFDVNARDLNGRTPLMYAAKCGSTEASIMLLQAGANIWLEDYLYGHHDFLYFAARQQHWELVIEVLDFIRGSSRFSDEDTKSLLDAAVVLWAGSGSESRSSSCFKSLLSWGVNPDIMFEANYMWSHEWRNTLLHCITYSADFDTLVESGFTRFNQANSKGTTPLMMIMERSGPGLAQKAVSRGCQINDQDRYGRTALHVSIEEIWEPINVNNGTGYYRREKRSRDIDCAKVLLRNEADPFLGDFCRCACSTAGCTPGILLLKEHLYWIRRVCAYPLGAHIWSLEYLQAVADIRGTECAQRCLLEMIRIVRFEELELTHTCCRKQSQRGLWQTISDESDIDEIMDEERDIIRDLDLQMEEVEKNIYRTDIIDTWIQELGRLLPVRAGRYPRYPPLPADVLTNDSLTKSSTQSKEVSDSNLIQEKS
jgi:ankyrin repeat protein